jgi:dephospho-CoA kinase
MVIGIIGEYCSGKSFLTKRISELYNAEIIDTDELIPQIMTYPPVINKILSEFRILPKEENLEKLEKIVFSNLDNIEKFEKIIYPVIENEIRGKLNKDLVIIDHPSLGRTEGIKDLCDEIIITVCPALIRFIRAKKRGNYPTKEIFNRFRNRIDIDDWDIPFIVHTNRDINIQIREIMGQII